MRTISKHRHAAYKVSMAQVVTKVNKTDEKITEVVGETGFEPATPWTQTKCATKLRYSPTYKTEKFFKKWGG